MLILPSWSSWCGFPSTGISGDGRTSGADVADGGVVPGDQHMRAWRMGEERAETYLRLLAEVELGRGR